MMRTAEGDLAPRASGNFLGQYPFPACPLPRIHVMLSVPLYIAALSSPLEPCLHPPTGEAQLPSAPLTRSSSLGRARSLQVPLLDTKTRSSTLFPNGATGVIGARHNASQPLPEIALQHRLSLQGWRRANRRSYCRTTSTSTGKRHPHRGQQVSRAGHIATAPLAGVLAYAFSCEWSRRGPQNQSSGSIAVSTLTVGLMDRGIYALFKRASLQFILAFIASLLATILSAVAPATISINPILLNRPTTLSVGSFDNLDSTAAIAGAFLSNALVFMEQIQNVSYGFDMPPGVLFGMPGRDLLGQNLSWTYNVVYYNYTCTYRAPTYQLFDQGNPVWDRVQWVVDGEIYESDSSVASARPTLADRTGFFETGYDISPLSGIWPLTSGNEGSNGTLAWLFIGINNATYGHDQYYSDIPWRVEFLSLQNLPTKNTTYNGTGFSDLWPAGAPPTGNA
ncbi:hypothetical protein HWV62_38094 [Athelia sp. TMB]|nr:hypothetical protein HWV62_38094 [Athelia sp. TMB]